MTGVEATIPPDTIATLKAFFTNPIIVLIHVLTWTIVHFSKYFVCQWLPLQAGNFLVWAWNQSAANLPDVTRHDYRDVVCSQTRKGLTWIYATLLCYAVSLWLLPMVILIQPEGWSLTDRAIAIVNGVANPAAFLLLLWLLSRSAKTRPLAAYLGAREINMKRFRAELEEEPEDAGRTILRHTFGIGKGDES